MVQLQNFQYQIGIVEIFFFYIDISLKMLLQFPPVGMTIVLLWHLLILNSENPPPVEFLYN